MALSIVSMDSSSYRKKTKRNKGGISFEKILLAAKFLFPLLIVFISYTLIAFVDSCTNKMAKEKAKFCNAIEGFDREIENLKIDIQRAKGGNIPSQIKRFGLKLNYPKPGQKRELVRMADNKKDNGKAKLLVMKRRH
jgi:hypothetical protein